MGKSLKIIAVALFSITLCACSNSSNKKVQDVSAKQSSNTNTLAYKTSTIMDANGFYTKESLPVAPVLKGTKAFPFAHSICVYDNKADKIYTNYLQGEKDTLYNVRFYPASTFKLVNSIIYLETGLVKSKSDKIYTYDGAKLDMQVWQRDVSLKDAFLLSHYPAFEAMLDYVSDETYDKFLDLFSYGNKEHNNKGFWVYGPIAISDLEQATFLVNLYSKKYKLKHSTYDAIFDMSYITDINGYKLYGKTGLTNEKNFKVSHFVGALVKDEHVIAFSTTVLFDKESFDINLLLHNDMRKQIAMDYLMPYLKAQIKSEGK